MAQSINTIRLLHQSLQLSIKAGVLFVLTRLRAKATDTVFLANLAGPAGSGAGHGCAACRRWRLQPSYWRTSSDLQQQSGV